MKKLTSKLATIVAAVVLATSGLAQSAKEVRGPTPFIPVGQEPPAKLIVDAPIPLALAHGAALIQYRTENVHIVPVFGPQALNVFPRVGHLHITVDDAPWRWADASDTGTIDVRGLPPGPHKIQVDLVDGNHQLFSGQSVTVNFTMPETVSESH